LANLATDGELIEKARKAAIKILEQDPNLKRQENSGLLNYMREKNRGKANWSRIS
jgi:ATP-dependent DNA helicase RecG